MESSVNGTDTSKDTSESDKEPSTSEKVPPTNPRGNNWMLIALIAVSSVALLLLASTITLAVVGDFGGRGRGFKMERNFCPMHGPEGGNPPGRRDRQWRREESPDRRQYNDQDNQSTPETPQQQGGQ